MGNHDEGHSSTNIHKHWNIKIQRAILEPLSKHYVQFVRLNKFCKRNTKNYIIS